MNPNYFDMNKMRHLLAALIVFAVCAGCGKKVDVAFTATNVAIDPDYQGLHLGMEIITRLAAQMNGQNIFLNTHPGGVGFYNRKGFRRNKTALLYSANPVMPKRIKKGFVLPKGYRFPDEL